MKKTLITLTAVTAVLLTGCGGAEGADRKGSNGENADRVTDVDSAVVYRNIDNFPNVERVCIDGLGFAATRSFTDSGDAISPNLFRVPEWDEDCGAPPR